MYDTCLKDLGIFKTLLNNNHNNHHHHKNNNNNNSSSDDNNNNNTFRYFVFGFACVEVHVLREGRNLKPVSTEKNIKP